MIFVKTNGIKEEEGKVVDEKKWVEKEKKVEEV
jgi:hypothetical protein